MAVWSFAAHMSDMLLVCWSGIVISFTVAKMYQTNSMLQFSSHCGVQAG
jgi:hypothetical protein